MTQLRFLDPLDSRMRCAWDEAVHALGGTVFHTAAWMDVIHKGMGLEPRFAYLASLNNSIQGLVPLFRAGGLLRPVRWLNIPHSCPSDPLAPSTCEAEALLEAVSFAALSEGAKAIVLRTAREFRPVMPEGWETRRETPVLRHQLRLIDARDVESLPNVRSKHRQNFRTLRRTIARRGMGIHRIRANETTVFVRALHRILLRAHGHLGLPPGFFKALLALLPETSRLIVVDSGGGSELAFLLCVWSGPNSYGLYGSGMPTKEGREAYRWCLGEEIDAAISAGIHTFDFGETGPHQRGLIFHKEGWGADRVDGSYLILARKGQASGLRVSGKNFAWAAPFIRRLPVSLSLQIAGPVHRHLQ